MYTYIVIFKLSLTLNNEDTVTKISGPNTHEEQVLFPSFHKPF